MEGVVSIEESGAGIYFGFDNYLSGAKLKYFQPCRGIVGYFEQHMATCDDFITPVLTTYIYVEKMYIAATVTKKQGRKT